MAPLAMGCGLLFAADRCEWPDSECVQSLTKFLAAVALAWPRPPPRGTFSTPRSPPRSGREGPCRAGGREKGARVTTPAARLQEPVEGPGRVLESAGAPRP